MMQWLDRNVYVLVARFAEHVTAMIRNDLFLEIRVAHSLRSRRKAADTVVPFRIQLISKLSPSNHWGSMGVTAGFPPVKVPTLKARDGIALIPAKYLADAAVGYSGLSARYKNEAVFTNRRCVCC